MGLYKQFEASTDFERDGIWIDYGEFRVKLRFAGGANKAYVSLLEVTMKPFRRAIQQGSFPEERSRRLLMTVYAKTMIADWETAQTDDKGVTSWAKGIEGRDGKLLPVSPDNLIDTFNNLNNLFIDLIEQGTTASNFRLADLEADGKNLKRS